MAGCSATEEITRTQRGAIEQLLLSQSLERTLDALSVPELRGSSVLIETQGLPTDLPLVRALVEERLLRQRSRIKERKENAQYVVKVIVHSIGTQQALTFIGIPESRSSLMPIPFPELALYKEQRQKGYARLSFHVINASTGEVVTSLPWRAGSAYYNSFTIFFFIGFPSTDLVLAPLSTSGLEHALRQGTWESPARRDPGRAPETHDRAPP